MNKRKYWKPILGKSYWCLSSSGKACNYIFIMDFDVEAQLIGNCFPSEEEAMFMREKLRVIQKLKTFAYENNEEEIDWNNDEQKKFFLYYDYFKNKVLVDYVTYMKDTPFNIYFTSESIAEKSIKAIGEEYLKKYYFDIKEKK